MCDKTISTFEFMQMFGSEDDARTFFEEQRWGGNVICPHCEHDSIMSLKQPGLYRCKGCRKNFTVRIGTIMEDTKIKYSKWLYAIYTIMVSRKGISSLQLSKEIGVTQKSAWYLCHRIRGACADNNLGGLQGVVEMDATYIGGKEGNKHANKKLKAGRGTTGKQAVLGIKERDGRVKAMVVRAEDQEVIQDALQEHVEPGTHVYTDDHRGYARIGDADYTHEAVKHSAKEYVNGQAHTNSIESVWAVLKRGYNGTFHHFSTKHLHRYVDEFTFRLNEGNVEIHAVDRMKFLVKGLFGKTLTYKDLIA